MRNFKIVVITLLLIGLAGLALWGIKGLIPGVGPSAGEFDDIYNDQHDHEMLDDDIYQTEIKQYEGMVKILGVSIYQEASHRLEDQDRLVVLLKSDTVDLNEYLNKRVKVQGIVSDTSKGDQKLMNVTKIDALSDEGVKSFDDLRFEMSFNFPNSWQYRIEDKKITFTQTTSESEETMMIVYQYDSEKQPLDVWLKDRDQNLFYDESEVAVGNMTGVRRVIKNGDEEIIKTYLKSGDNCYELRLVAQDQANKGQYFDLLESFQSFSDADEAMEEDVETEVQPKDESSDEAMMEEKKEEVTKVPEASKATDESSTTTSTEDNGQSFTNLSPLSSADIQAALEKGFSPFEGRSLSFQYPKVWYFSYLGDQKYGFTDHNTYTSSNGEISADSSRVMILAGEKSVSCASEQTRTISGVTYTVCARETGLQSIIEKIADSLK